MCVCEHVRVLFCSSSSQRRYVGDPSSRSGDDGYVSKGAFGKQSRLSKQKHQITAVAMDLMLNEKEILAVSPHFVFLLHCRSAVVAHYWPYFSIS
jgi:hypothetical protein